MIHPADPFARFSLRRPRVTELIDVANNFNERRYSADLKETTQLLKLLVGFMQ